MNELRQEIELPALDVTEEEAALALRAMRLIYDGPYMEPGQMITLLQAKLDASYRVVHCRERQLKSSLAANREQEAEIERILRNSTDLVGCAEVDRLFAIQRAEKAEAELASLRVSVGEKWIAFNEGVEAAAVAVEEGWDGWDGVVARIRREKHPVAPTYQERE